MEPIIGDRLLLPGLPDCICYAASRFVVLVTTSRIDGEIGDFVHREDGWQRDLPRRIRSPARRVI
jgi:hypothetical protein